MRRLLSRKRTWGLDRARDHLENALHNQAVKDPGQQIAIVGREQNQVVQAIEHLQLGYMLGVQWHPEYLPQDTRQRRLFQALVQQARKVQLQIEDVDMQEALAQPVAPNSSN